MSVIFAPNLVLSGEEATYGLTADHPVIGWQTFVVPGAVTATTSVAAFPPRNMANPATHLAWRGGATSATEYVTLTPSPEIGLVDYVAIARHNIGSAQISISIGYETAGPTWVELVPPVYLGDDGPALFRFNAQTLTNVKIKLLVGLTAPQIAVAYAGKLLTLPRKLYQGFAPIPYGRTAKVTNGRSEAGQFLGRIVLQEFVRDTVPLSLISPTYFRDHIAAFLADSKENPFFFAWRPQSYPHEIGYCHMTNDPVPVNEAPHGLIAMSMEMTGVL